MKVTLVLGFTDKRGISRQISVTLPVKGAIAFLNGSSGRDWTVFATVPVNELIPHYTYPLVVV